jgi:hypothetical protein
MFPFTKAEPTVSTMLPTSIISILQIQLRNTITSPSMKNNKKTRSKCLLSSQQKQPLFITCKKQTIKQNTPKMAQNYQFPSMVEALSYTTFDG